MYFQQIKCFKKTYLQQIDPINEWLMLAVKATLASLIAAWLANFYVHNQSMFLILGTIFFMITYPDASKKQQLIAILLAGGLGTIGVFWVTLCSQHLLPLLLITAIYTMIACYANGLNLNYGMAGLLALLLVITAGGVAGDKIIAYQRLENCLLGLIIALIVNFIILPKNPARRLKRGLLVLLSDMTDYFYHTSADCLRGSHINARHWQIKERILFVLNKTNGLTKEIKAHSAAIEPLQKLLLAEEKLWQILLPLTTIMTSPANNTAFINILPTLAEFSAATHKLFLGYKQYLQQPITLTGEENFLRAVDKLQTEIGELINNTLQKPIIYQWPFDLSMFSYLLALFAKEMLAFDKVLLAVTK